jgi:hypothetical protein
MLSIAFVAFLFTDSEEESEDEASKAEGKFKVYSFILCELSA